MIEATDASKNDERQVKNKSKPFNPQKERRNTYNG